MNFPSIISNAIAAIFKSYPKGGYSFSELVPQKTLKSCLFLLTLISASPVFAESFVVDGNKALNTNNTFVKVDGNPRMSIWDFNPNDADQQFDRIPGNGGTLLKHRSTGKCLNSHYLNNGGVVNTWPCSASDPDQNFNIISVGNDYSLIQRRGTNRCVDSPTRNNGGMVQLWDCNQGNANQRWKNSGTTTVIPPEDYSQKRENFIRSFVGQWAVSRLDPQSWDSRGQCVTLIARYIQEVYLTGSQKTQSIAFGNGRDTANVVASKFSNFFSPATSQGLPNRGAVVSFPDLGYVPKSDCPNWLCGHTAIVMESRTINGQRQIRIMDSNGDGLAPNTQTKEYYSPKWINIPDGRSNGYGNNIYWTNPK